MTTEYDKKSKLMNQLERFTGTSGYHRYSPLLFPSFLLTDGCKHLAEEAECFWLFDEIAALQAIPKIHDLDIQFWTLTVHTEKYTTLICELNSGVVIFSEEISFTTFPLEKIKIWVGFGFDEYSRVAMLPSEY
jgi:hypothetical protein